MAASFRIKDVRSKAVVVITRIGEKKSHSELWALTVTNKATVCARCRKALPHKKEVFSPISNALHRAERLCVPCVRELVLELLPPGCGRCTRGFIRCADPECATCANDRDWECVNSEECECWSKGYVIVRS